MRSEAGMYQLCARLKVKRKRARHHVHSPDQNYREKLQLIHEKVGWVEANPDDEVILFMDEFTLYRHPSLASAYECVGKQQPLAELGLTSNKTWRYVAALNVLTGRIIFLQDMKIGVANLIAFYQQVVKAYPHAKTIWIIQDNWPVHFHPDVLAALQTQEFPFGFPKPRNWSDQPSSDAQHLNLPIRILCLPTYASWTNPIEKLWRFLQQEVTHLHHFADDWAGLKQAVTSFLQQFAVSSLTLLRYVGLSQPSRLYHSLFLIDTPATDMSIQI